MQNTPDSIVEGLIFTLQGMQTSDYATEGLAPRFHHTENLTDELGPSSPMCWDHQVRPLKYTASFRMMKDSPARRALPDKQTSRRVDIKHYIFPRPFFVSGIKPLTLCLCGT
jgi:hypothetical protein